MIDTQTLHTSETFDSPKRRRKSLIGIAALLVLVFSLDSTPSVPSVPDPVAGGLVASPEEILALEELADWLLGGPEEGGLRAMSSRDLRSLVREGPRSFEIFRTYHDEDERLSYVRGLPYGTEIARAARGHGLDPLLVAALVEAESSFVPRAISAQGAVGLMQVLPSTGQLLGGGDLGNPTVNLDVGCRYLRSLLSEFEGDIELALAAYNAGPGAVHRYDGVPPYRETRGYVSRVIARYVDHHHRVWESSGATDHFRLR